MSMKFPFKPLLGRGWGGVVKFSVICVNTSFLIKASDLILF